MKKENDENVLDYWRLPDGNFLVKLKKDDVLDDDNDVENYITKSYRSFYFK